MFRVFPHHVEIRVGSNPVPGFRIFGVFRWVHSSILVDEPWFRRVRSLVFPDLGLGLAHFWPNWFEVRVFWSGSKEFKVRFWWTNLGSIEFEVRPIKFKAVQSLLCLGLLQP